MFAANWTIIPNLAGDILSQLLLHLLPVHVAGRVLLGGILLLNLAGVTALHRALFGRRSLWPLASALVAYNAGFLLGFLNWQIGCGMAMLAASAWLRWRDAHPAATIAAAIAASVVLFFCHLVAVLFFLVLVGSAEVEASLAGAAMAVAQPGTAAGDAAAAGAGMADRAARSADRGVLAGPGREAAAAGQSAHQLSAAARYRQRRAAHRRRRGCAIMLRRVVVAAGAWFRRWCCWQCFTSSCRPPEEREASSTPASRVTFGFLLFAVSRSAATVGARDRQIAGVALLALFAARMAILADAWTGGRTTWSEGASASSPMCRPARRST